MEKPLAPILTWHH